MNTITNADIRHHAWSIVQRHFGKLFLMLAAAAAAPLLVTGLLIAIFMSFLPAPAELFANPALIQTIIPTLILLGLLNLLFTTLITPAVMLGLHHSILTMIRGLDAAILDVFSQLGYCLRAFLLTLYVGLRTWLWMFPGLCVTLLGAWIGGGFGAFAMGAGAVAAFVLMIVASFRYTMALPALADQPELGILAAFDKGKDIMRGRKWQLFCLLLIYALITVAVVLFASLLMAAFSRVYVMLALISLLEIIALLVIGTILQVANLTFYAVYADSM